MIEIGHTYYPASAVLKRPVECGTTLQDYAVLTGTSLIEPVVCVVNDRPVMRGEWPDLCVVDGDVVVFIHLPLGGGGDSDPLRVAAMIGLMALAVTVPGMLPATSFFAKGFGAALLSGGIMAGGSALLNAVMPVQTPTAAQNYAVSASSSTYALSVPTNAQRIGQVIQVQYGRVMTTPPIISQPWSEYDGGSEYIYVLICLGWGYFEIEKIMFDNLPFEQFTDVEYHVLEPGDTVPFRDNVYTSPHVTGQEIYRKNNYEYVPANGAALAIGDPNDPPLFYWDKGVIIRCVDSSAFNFSIGDKIYIENSELNAAQYYTVSGIYAGYDTQAGYSFVKTQQELYPESVSDGAIRQFGGVYSYTDFYPSYYRANDFVYGYGVHCDVLFPNGLYTARDDGTIDPCSVQLCIVYRLIDADGVVGSETNILPGSGDTTISGSQKTPLRISLGGTLPGINPGHGFLIGVRRTAATSSLKKMDTCGWAGLRVDYPNIGTYPGLTTIQVKAIASEGLSQDALSKIRVLSTRKLPIFNGETWSAPTATRSIAWAAADACRNADYSIGMPASRIDLQTLMALDAIWTARGDLCDGIFDTKTIFWDGLKSILRAGRAQPHMVGGAVTFTRDQPQTAKKGVFTPRNIVRGSFSIEYVLYDPDTPDDVELEYLDEITWAWTSLTCSLPESDGEAPANMKLWGVTQGEQAEREGYYEAACNMLRRTFVTFQTELDARVILRGHLVSVSHPLPNWGISGEVLAVCGQILRVSEPVEFGIGGHYISLRRADGTSDGPYIVTAGPDDTHIVMTDPVPSHVYTGFDREKTHFQFGPGTSFEKRCLVISARPKAQGRVELLCVVENDAVHTADGTGGTP